MWEILSEVQPVLSRFPAYSLVEVSDDDDDEIISWRRTGIQARFAYVIDFSSALCNTYDRIRLSQQQCNDSPTHHATFEFPAVRAGPIHVHDKAEVHWRSVTLWRLLRLHRLFGRAELLWLIDTLPLSTWNSTRSLPIVGFPPIDPNFDFIISLYYTDERMPCESKVDF